MRFRRECNRTPCERRQAGSTRRSGRGRAGILARTVSGLALGSLVVLAVGVAAAEDGIEPLLARVREVELARGNPRELLSLLEHEQPVVRARAALALGRMKARSALDPVVKALRGEKVPVVRRGLLFALGEIKGGAAMLSAFATGHPPFGRPRKLYKQTAEERQADVAHAVRALGKCGDQAHLLVLAGLLRQGPAAVRAESAIAIALIARRDPKIKEARAFAITVEALTQAVKGETRESGRWRMAYGLAALAARGAASKPVGETLARLAGSGQSERTRIFALRGLGSLRKETKDDARPSSTGLTYAEGLPWRVAVARLRALGQWSPDVQRRRVPAYLAHDSFHVRRLAANMLGETASDGSADRRSEMVVALRSCLDDAWETVRGEALVALTKLDPSGSRGAIQTFAQEGVVARRYAVRALAALPSVPDSLSEACSQLEQDKDHRVLMAVVEELGAKPGAHGFKLLNTALAHDRVAVVGAALSVLAKRKDEGIFKALSRLYRNSKKDRSRYELRELICQALGERYKGQAAKPVVKLLRRIADGDPRGSVRLAAAKALESLTGHRPSVVLPPDPASDKRPKQPWIRGAASLLFETSRGPMTVELDPERCPDHVRNIVDLARKGFYDGLIWHRVVSNFVIQGGCPNGDGWGDPGWTLPDELDDRPFERGSLGMPKAGPDTGGCQLFFMHAPAPHLDGRYTMFGRVTRGLSVLDRIEEGDRILKVTAIVGPGTGR